MTTEALRLASSADLSCRQTSKSCYTIGKSCWSDRQVLQEQISQLSQFLELTNTLSITKNIPIREIPIGVALAPASALAIEIKNWGLKGALSVGSCCSLRGRKRQEPRQGSKEHGRGRKLAARRFETVPALHEHADGKTARSACTQLSKRENFECL